VKKGKRRRRRPQTPSRLASRGRCSK